MNLIWSQAASVTNQEKAWVDALVEEKKMLSNKSPAPTPKGNSTDQDDKKIA